MGVAWLHNILNTPIMTRTITEGFQKLLSNLEVTELQEATVSTRQKNVRAVVEDGMSVLDTFLTGSYRRNTMIGPLNKADVDIFVVLDPKYYNEYEPAGLLDRLKSVLRKTYTTPTMSRNGQAVTIKFSDFEVDVVPAFNRSGGGYLIPDSERGSWISTDPKQHVAMWATANKAHNGDLVPVIKMVKGWNKPRDLFRSFHLEVLIKNVLEGVRIDSYPSAARFVFEKMQAKIRVKVPDPAGYSDDVAAYVNSESQMAKLIERLEWARQTAAEAETLEGNGQTIAAYEKWKLIFKDYFPAYG